MNASVIIPPSIKPYYPSYTAGILADIIRKQDIVTSIIDVNLLFFNHIYRNDLEIYVDNHLINISSKRIYDSVNALKKDKGNQFNEERLKKAYNEIKARNIMLNKYIKGIRFGFFDVKIIHNDVGIAHIFSDKDMNVFFERIFKDFMPEIDSDIIFFSAMSVEQLYFSYIISKCIKLNNINSKIVIGGPFLENQDNRDYTLLLKWFDCICTGDAELVFPEIIRSFKQHNILLSTKGTISCIDGEILVSGRCVSGIKDVIKYELNTNDFINNHYFYPIERIPRLTSRECCYGKCEFCTNKGKDYHECRIKKSTRILDEIRNIKIEDKAIIEFIDDNIHAKYLLSFAQGVCHFDLKIKWIANSRFYEDYLKYSNCNLLYNSGCKKLFLGLESYNQNTLDSMKKGIKVFQILPILENLKSVGIKTHISILFGFPGETLEQAKITQNFLYDHLSLIDIVEINCFVSHGKKYYRESLYDARGITQETRNMIKQYGKDPTFYNIYKCMI